MRRYIPFVSVAIISMAFAGIGVLFRPVSAASTPTVCKSLNVRQSDDKNYYIFTAQSVPGTGATVTHYVFDFGDTQTYRFEFPANATSRNKAVVRHTYQKSGDFTARTTVFTKTDGKTVKTTSPACTAHVVNGNVAATLAKTGPSDVLTLFAVVVLVSGSLHFYCRNVVTPLFALKK